METAIYILSGLALGFLIGWFIAKSRLVSLHGREMLNKNQEISGLREQIAVLTTKMEADRESLRVAQEAMLEKFTSAASAALGQNSEQFLKLARTQFEAHKTEAGADLDQRKNAIKEMLGPLREAIEGYKLKVEELGTTSNITFGQVKEMLSSLQLASTGLQKETGELVNALKNPQSRGRWGELGLRNLVIYAGMLEHCDFNEQVHKEGEDTVIKPDMVVNLPDNKHAVVDSKVPLKAYMESLETRDEKTRNQLLAAHARSVRERINELSKKQYYAQFTNSPDLVVLFMPIESALNAALTTDKDLLEYSIQKRIILATPTTLLVVLKSFALIWQQHSMTENAMEILETSRILHERLSVFSDYLAGIGNGLRSALRSYNDAVGSFESRILVTGRKLEELGAKSKKDHLKNIGPVDENVRMLNRPDDQL
ncbi:MAG TPA: DNA recombination protein RmuC [Bacteroidales bacterium]|jgi:DNA recombination protein RmuC|nr:DNA recombination protein RmuC [Bacteroidales bacterium]